jgi:hypothetical protein
LTRAQDEIRARYDDARDEHVLAAADADRVLCTQGRLVGAARDVEAEDTYTSLGGFIEVARKAGAEFVLPMAADLKLFKYTRIKRPLYPFDPDMRLGRNA